jgi:hypothetical protein
MLPVRLNDLFTGIDVLLVPSTEPNHGRQLVPISLSPIGFDAAFPGFRQ